MCRIPEVWSVASALTRLSATWSVMGMTMKLAAKFCSLDNRPVKCLNNKRSQSDSHLLIPQNLCFRSHLFPCIGLDFYDIMSILKAVWSPTVECGPASKETLLRFVDEVAAGGKAVIFIAEPRVVVSTPEITPKLQSHHRSIASFVQCLVSKQVVPPQVRRFAVHARSGILAGLKASATTFRGFSTGHQDRIF